VDQKNAVFEPALRDKISRIIPEVWLSRLEPHGRVLYVGTAWHGADYTHQIMHNPAWSVLVQGVSDDFRCLDQWVYNPPKNYSIPAMR
jgi:hypothetical protein